MSNFIVNPSSVSRDAILLDLQNYLATTADAAKWNSFFASATGQTVLELVSGFGAYLSYNAIVARREAFWKNAENYSSVVSGAQSVGYSASRGRNAVLTLTVTPVITGVLNKYSIVGSVKDQDLILLNDTIVNAGVQTTLQVVVGMLQEEQITINTNSLSSFRFTQANVSEDARLLLNGVVVESSSKILDLVNGAFVMQTNPLGSVDVSYLNFDSFPVTYQTNDVLTLQWVTLANVTFSSTNVKFDFGTLNSFQTVSVYQGTEGIDSVKVNASLFNETQFVIRGREDYLKIFRQLDPTLVSTSGSDPSAAQVELSYVKEDYSLYLPIETAQLVVQLMGLRPFGVKPPTIQDPTIVFLVLNVKVVPLPNTTGDSVTAVNSVLDPYQGMLNQLIDFETVENKINSNAFIKISRITINAPTWVAGTDYLRGNHVSPTTSTGLIYEVSDIAYFSNAVEPNWNCTIGATTIDKGIVWVTALKGACDTPSNWIASHRYKIEDVVQSATSLCPGKMFVATNYINLSSFSEEIQKIEFSSLPASGTWRIEFGSEATTDLAFNANAAAVQNALNALPDLSAIAVTGNYASGFTVNFAGADANKPQAQFTFNSAGVNDVQCVNFSVAPNAGSFKLQFNGFTTSFLPYTSTASQIQTALEALTSVGAGNAIVTGNFTNNFNIAFQGTLAAKPLPALTVVNNTLSAAEAVTTGISTLTDGRAASAGHSAVQKLSFSKVPQAGTFVINFDQQVTGPIGFGATASQIQTAFQALSTVGAGNALVTGNFTSGFTFTFQNGLSNQSLVQTIAQSNSLVKYQPSTGSVITVQNGGAGNNEIQTVSFDYVPDTGNWQLSLNYAGIAEVTRVTVTGDISGTLNNKYWFFNTPAQNYYVWYNVNGAGVDPAIGGRIGIQVAINTNDSANTVNVQTINAITAAASANVQAFSANVLTLTNVAQGQVTDASSQSSGFTIQVITQGVNPTNTTSVLTPATTYTTLQAALEALPNIGAGNVEVLGDFSTGFIVTFRAGLGNLNIPTLQVVNNTLIQTQSSVITPSSLTQGIAPDAGTDEVQKIQFSETPDSGTWVLNFNGNNSPTLSYSANALAVQTALNTLPALGGCQVTGSFSLGFTITFSGPNGLINQPALIVSSNSLAASSVPVTASPCLVTLGTYPAQNIKNSGNAAVAVTATVLSNATNPEPGWFLNQIVC